MAQHALHRTVTEWGYTQSLTCWLTCEGWVCMLLASGCRWEVLSVWGRLPHRLIPCPRAWWGGGWVLVGGGVLPLPEISHCSSLFDCKCCLSPSAAFQCARHTNVIDGKQIWESHSSWRNDGGKQLLTFGRTIDTNGIFALPGNSLCCKWQEKFRGTIGRRRNIPVWADSCVCSGNQYNNWVWMYSLVVNKKPGLVFI